MVSSPRFQNCKSWANLNHVLYLPDNPIGGFCENQSGGTPCVLQPRIRFLVMDAISAFWPVDHGPLKEFHAHLDLEEGNRPLAIYNGDIVCRHGQVGNNAVILKQIHRFDGI